MHGVTVYAEDHHSGSWRGLPLCCPLINCWFRMPKWTVWGFSVQPLVGARGIFNTNSSSLWIQDADIGGLRGGTVLLLATFITSTTCFSVAFPFILLFYSHFPSSELPLSTSLYFQHFNCTGVSTGSPVVGLSPAHPYCLASAFP